MFEITHMSSTSYIKSSFILHQPGFHVMVAFIAHFAITLTGHVLFVVG